MSSLKIALGMLQLSLLLPSIASAAEPVWEATRMPDYRGYVLFDWVHPGLNVPAACKDLKALK